MYEELMKAAEKALLSTEPVLPEKTYAEGVMDTLQYVEGQEPHPLLLDE